MRARTSALVALVVAGAVSTGGALDAPAGLAASASADVRVTHDDQPRSYLRYDGQRDDVTRFCSTSRRPQREPAVAVDPRKPLVVVVATIDNCRLQRAQHLAAEGWISLHRSIDGGHTWSSTLVPGYPGDTSPAGLQAPFRSDPTCPQQLEDPSVAFDSVGRLYVGLQCGDDEPSSLLKEWMAVYADDGSRYVRTVQVAEPAPCSDDRDMTAVDTTGGPYDGTVYVVFNRSAPGNWAMSNACPASTSGVGTMVLVARSTDHGATFEPPVQIPMPDLSPTASLHTSDIAVGPDGAVYAVVRDFDKDVISLSKSVDGGHSFRPAVPVSEPPPFWSGMFSGYGVNGETKASCGEGPWQCQNGRTLPTFSGDLGSIVADETGVHVAWGGVTTDGRGRIFVRSSPDGVTWPTKPVLIAPVPSGHQWDPDASGANGVISVAFYDSRLDPAFAPDLPPGNTRDGKSSGPSTDVFVARSIDGGVTWTERRLTSTSFNVNMLTHSWARLPFVGDYLQVSSGGGRMYAVWTDNRDVVAGTDTRQNARNNGFSVYTPCNWQPNNVYTEKDPVTGADDHTTVGDYASPAWTDPCLSKGGLDQNIYGAPVS